MQINKNFYLCIPIVRSGYFWQEHRFTEEIMRKNHLKTKKMNFFLFIYKKSV